ncbi:MAG: hypothetical protein U1F41_05785 [Burkholderiales bacterium]
MTTDPIADCEEMCNWARQEARRLLEAEGVDWRDPRYSALVERAVEGLRAQITARRDALAQAAHSVLH